MEKRNHNDAKCQKIVLPVGNCGLYDEFSGKEGDDLESLPETNTTKTLKILTVNASKGAKH